MDNLTLDETKSMLYGMLLMGGFSRTECDIIRAAIGHLERLEEIEEGQDGQ